MKKHYPEFDILVVFKAETNPLSEKSMEVIYAIDWDNLEYELGDHEFDITHLRPFIMDALCSELRSLQKYDGEKHIDEYLAGENIELTVCSGCTCHKCGKIVMDCNIRIGSNTATFSLWNQKTMTEEKMGPCI